MQLPLLFVGVQVRSMLRLARACLLRSSWQSHAVPSSAQVKYRMPLESMTRSTTCDIRISAMPVLTRWRTATYWTESQREQRARRFRQAICRVGQP